MEQSADYLGTMPINKLAFKISIPMVLSMISIALYGIIDTMFISQINNNALTAVSLAIPIQSIITAIALGTSIGLNALLSKTLGENNYQKTKDIMRIGFLLTLLNWIIIIIASEMGLKHFFSIFVQNDEIKELGYNYLHIISIFSFGSLFQILFEKILEAYGKSKSSMLVQISRCSNKLNT